MLCDYGQISGAGGVHLFVREWHAERHTARAIIVLAHGHGEHSERYENVAAAMTRAGFIVAAFDHQGHGRSGGKRGHMLSIESAVEDTELVMAYIRRRHPAPELPMFLYGHSMGGNIALNCALRLDLDIRGLILTSPWLRLAFKPSAVKEWVGRRLASILPALPMSTGLKEEDLYRPGELGIAPMKDDPLCHTTITPSAFMSIQEAGEWALRHAEELTLPLLLMHGTADRITSYQASEFLAGKIGSRCAWKPWPGGFHELHNDVEGESALRTIIDWVNRQISH